MIGISNDTLRKAYRHYLFEMFFFCALIVVGLCAEEPYNIDFALGGLVIVATRAVLNLNRVAKAMDDRELN
jgi:hypothetical protein